MITRYYIKYIVLARPHALIRGIIVIIIIIIIIIIVIIVVHDYISIYTDQPSWKRSKKTAVLGRLQWWLDTVQPFRRKIPRTHFEGKTQRVWKGMGESEREFGTEPPWRKTIKLNTNAYPVFRRARYVQVYNVIITTTAQKATLTYNIIYVHIYCTYIKAVDGSPSL